MKHLVTLNCWNIVISNWRFVDPAGVACEAYLKGLFAVAAAAAAALVVAALTGGGRVDCVHIRRAAKPEFVRLKKSEWENCIFNRNNNYD